MNFNIQEIVLSAVKDVSWSTFFIVFWAGAVLSLASCTIIRVPVIIGYVGGASESKKKAFFITLSFALGIILSYTCLGVLFGLASGIMASMIRHSRFIYYAIGSIALVAGIKLAGLTKKQFVKKDYAVKYMNKKAGIIGAFLFGMIFAVFEAPVCPCCGPVLFLIAGITLSKGKILFGILIFLTYAIGQSLPLLLIGTLTGMVKYVSPYVERFEKTVEMIGGNILILLALFFFLVG